MAEETRTAPHALVPANDNGDLANPEGRPENMAAKLDRVVLDIARLIGRQLAREAFEAGLAANDNRPGRREGEGREPDGKPPGNRREDPPP
jgi:tetrahydromethanopterin S-methyltransferase subunit G